jgi:hypothetical protein
MHWTGTAGIAVACALAVGQPAAAQSTANREWKVAVYPVLGWVPLGIDIGVDVASDDGGGDGRDGEIVDGRFDGAFLGGVTATNDRVWIEADAIWAGVGGDRDLPRLTVDADIIYGHGAFGMAVAPGWFVTAGVRRLALKYVVKIGDRPDFERKPGVWDPLIGIGWHRPGRRIDWHATFDGGGFGAGSDVDVSGSVRFDWRVVSHFGLTAGYNFLYFKVADEVGGRPFTVKQSLHGPLFGLGIYF